MFSSSPIATITLKRALSKVMHHFLVYQDTALLFLSSMDKRYKSRVYKRCKNRRFSDGVECLERGTFAKSVGPLSHSVGLFHEVRWGEGAGGCHLAVTCLPGIGFRVYLLVGWGRDSAKAVMGWRAEDSPPLRLGVGWHRRLAGVGASPPASPGVKRHSGLLGGGG